jgi:hypothetical protein
VPDAAGIDLEDHVFRDVCCMIGQAFHMPGEHQQVGASGNQGRGLFHHPNQLAEDVPVKIINDKVTVHDTPRKRRVCGQKRIQAVRNHDPCNLQHLRKPYRPEQGRMSGEGFNAFGDIHGDITDALQLGIYAERGHQEPQITRNGLVQGEDAVTQGINLIVKVVDDAVPADDFLCNGEIPFEESMGGGIELPVDQRTHDHQFVLHFRQVPLKVPLHAVNRNGR